MHGLADKKRTRDDVRNDMRWVKELFELGGISEAEKQDKLRKLAKESLELL